MRRERRHVVQEAVAQDGRDEPGLGRDSRVAGEQGETLRLRLGADHVPVTGRDRDTDGVADELDNCPFVLNSDQGDSDLNGIGDACQRPEQLHATSAFLQAALDGSTTSAATDLAVADEPGFLERLVAIVRFRVASGLTNDPELLVQNLVGSLVQAGVVSEEEAPAFVDEVLDQLVLEVAVDVKPGTVPNAVNPSAKGIIPVAILSRNGFDALSVDPSTVRFGPSGASEAHGRGHREDVDGDGDWDLVLHFDTQRSGIRCGATSVSLEGLTFAGRQIAGSDSIVTVGCARR